MPIRASAAARMLSGIPVPKMMASKLRGKSSIAIFLANWVQSVGKNVGGTKKVNGVVDHSIQYCKVDKQSRFDDL